MKNSYLIAVGIAVAVTLWMASGMFGRQAAEPAQTALQRTTEAGLTRVQVASFSARTMPREVVIHGQTEAKRTANMRAETAGTVTELAVERGSEVKAGEVLLRLSDDGRAQQLEQARALLNQRKLEYEAARKLRKQQQLSESQEAEALTALRAAELALEQARLRIEYATVRAPFDGVLEERQVDLGDYLGVGDPMLSVVAVAPVLISGPVSELEYGKLSLGMPGRAELGNGEVIEGVISYLSATSDPNTRTYTVELEVANVGRRLPLGMTAQMHIPLGTLQAHRLPPSMLSLDDAGVLGVKGVDDEGMVRFYPVELLKSEGDGLWLGGIPGEVRLITVGQGFVRAGDRVEAVQAE